MKKIFVCLGLSLAILSFMGCEDSEAKWKQRELEKRAKQGSVMDSFKPFSPNDIEDNVSNQTKKTPKW